MSQCKFRLYPDIPEFEVIDIVKGPPERDERTCDHPDNMMGDCPYHWKEECERSHDDIQEDD